MSFHDPSVWWLLGLLLLPVLWWRWALARRPGRGAGVSYSSLEPLREAGVSWAVRLRWIVPALRTLALAVLVVCVARPRTQQEHARAFTEGIAIQLVVDRSGSMLAEDFELDRRRATRLQVVKSVVEAFVSGDDDDLPGRPDDLLGLISFATYADSVCPLTLDHGHLVDALRQTEVAPNEEDRATALGDAVALGVERLHGLERRPDLRGGTPVESKVMILLTDGESNAGDIDPLTAAEMAREFGIRIYTIGAGTENATIPVTDPRTGRVYRQAMRASLDEDTLEEIAELTDGQYFRATDGRSLAAIYAQIDELERTEVEQQRYTEYKEMSLDSVTLAGVRMPPLLPVVFALLALELLLGSTRLRVLR
ncbi:MAG: VWA domain-containing protein [Planctomycetes bacterium]|nr:VWA domain-containing protein [Planctomycetota bacterium]